jgi:threonine/homoserine/homoserine lactone efflux protein
LAVDPPIPSPPQSPQPAHPATQARWVVGFVLGVVLLVIGAYIALRPLWNRHPITGARWFDMAFALLFLLRGAVNIRTARARRARARSGP